MSEENRKYGWRHRFALYGIPIGVMLAFWYFFMPWRGAMLPSPETNLRKDLVEISTALQIYLADHDNHMPLGKSTDRFLTALDSYMKGWDFENPETSALFNMQLSGMEITEFSEYSNEWLMAASNPKTKGKVVIIYLDSQTQVCTPHEALTIISQP